MLEAHGVKFEVDEWLRIGDVCSQLKTIRNLFGTEFQPDQLRQLFSKLPELKRFQFCPPDNFPARKDEWVKLLRDYPKIDTQPYDVYFFM